MAKISSRDWKLQGVEKDEQGDPALQGEESEQGQTRERTEQRRAGGAQRKKVTAENNRNSKVFSCASRLVAFHINQ